jgi:Flp pilus assembly protein TadG
MPVHGVARIWLCDRGNTAVEFALVLPALAALVVGTLYACLVLYSAAGLHSAVEQAARCYSVSSSQCGSAGATQSYAQTQYYGINTPTFTASTPSCGHQVSAAVTIVLTAVVANLSVPLSATACFP